MVGSLGLRTRLELNRSAYCPVEPVNLIGIHAFNTENLSYPVCAAPDGTARIPDCRSRIRLQHSVGPFPLALRVEGHIGLDLDPVRASAENRRDGQAYREGGADYDDWLVRRTENLRARKAAAVGINENIPIGGRARSKTVPAIGVNRLHIPSLTCGYDKVVG